MGFEQGSNELCLFVNPKANINPDRAFESCILPTLSKQNESWVSCIDIDIVDSVVVVITVYSIRL